MLSYHSNWYLIYAPDFSGAFTYSLSLTSKKVRDTGEERRQNTGLLKEGLALLTWAGKCFPKYSTVITPDRNSRAASGTFHIRQHYSCVSSIVATGLSAFLS